MYLSVINNGIVLTTYEGREKVVTSLKTYFDKGHAAKVLRMSREAGMSVEEVMVRLLPPKRLDPQLPILNLTEGVPEECENGAGCEDCKDQRTCPQNPKRDCVEVPPIPEKESSPSIRICKKCGSADLVILKKGNRNKLVCNECLAYQKFLNKADAATLLALQGK